MVTFLVIHGAGSCITDSGSFSQVVALAHFVFDTEEELKDTIADIHKKVRFIEEDGSDMVIRMLNTKRLKLKNQF